MPLVADQVAREVAEATFDQAAFAIVAHAVRHDHLTGTEHASVIQFPQIAEQLTKPAHGLCYARPSWPCMAPVSLMLSIQLTIARPISSGESSCTKWSPATVSSFCAGNPRAKSRFAPPAMSKPGSAFTNSLGTPLVASQSA